MPFDLQTQLSKFLQDLYAGTLGTLLPITQVQAGNGTVGAPAYAYASEPSSGVYRAGAGDVRVSVLGVDRVKVDATTTNLLSADGGAYLIESNGQVFVNSATLAMGTSGVQDVLFTRGAAGKVTLGAVAAATTAEWVVSGGNGGSLSAVKALTELTTIAAAASTNTTIALPVNAVVLAVTVRVVTIIPTAATFTVTSATPAKTWNTAAGVLVAAGTTDVGTAPGPSFQTTASVITITPNLTPGTGTGQVRVTAYFYTVTPATS